jgi:outer membrane protein assembly factor BamD
MYFALKWRKLLPSISACSLLLVMCLFASGCSSTNLLEFYFGDLFQKSGSSSGAEKNPAQLAAEGMEKMRKKDYGDAIKAFQSLKEHYPYSKYAILAELKLGDAHFYKKQYNEAALAYEEFARLHPRNEVVPYVIYQIGMCHFLSFTTIDRDPQETILAMESFRRVMQAYPKSEYARKAEKQIFECHKRIVAHEFYVGQFYYHLGEYRSSRDRLEKISREFPQAVKDLGYEKEIGKMCSVCEKHLQEGEKKPSIWTRLGF